MLIVGYCYGIRSERRLREEVELHLCLSLVLSPRSRRQSARPFDVLSNSTRRRQRDTDHGCLGLDRCRLRALRGAPKIHAPVPVEPTADVVRGGNNQAAWIDREGLEVDSGIQRDSLQVSTSHTRMSSWMRENKSFPSLLQNEWDREYSRRASRLTSSPVFPLTTTRKSGKQLSTGSVPSGDQHAELAIPSFRKKDQASVASSSRVVGVVHGVFSAPGALLIGGRFVIDVRKSTNPPLRPPLSPGYAPGPFPAPLEAAAATSVRTRSAISGALLSGLSVVTVPRSSRSWRQSASLESVSV
jgi:hypothetical protein